MKNIMLPFVLVVGAGLLSLMPRESEYRSDYKLLIDTAGRRVFAEPARASSIHELVTIERPREELRNQRADREKSKVTIVGYITHGRSEEDDGDYQLVVENEDGETLVAEIPAPESPKLRGYPNLRIMYKEAREFVTSNVDTHPGSVKELPNGRVKVTITGVVFFDKAAHGTGHAENGIEIHPVLVIAKAL